MQNPFFFIFFIKSLNISKKNFILFFCFTTILYTPIASQSPKELFQLSRISQNKGDFVNSEKYLISILKQKENIKDENIVAVNIQLGIINKSLGRYSKAVAYYLNGESLVLNNLETLRYRLPSIYNNLANIFKYKGDYNKALAYFKESIRNLNVSELNTAEKNGSLAYAYNNMGLVYMIQKKYDKAIQYFQKSIQIKKQNKLKGLSSSYTNYANCLREINNFLEAEQYYQKCINLRIKKQGSNYYKLAYVYKEYGKLKIKTEDFNTGIALYNSALKIYLANFGKKHPYTAEMYEIFGDYYLQQKDYKTALNYYQKSLIANSNTFSSSDIFKNPNTKDIFSEIQLLRSLKKKSIVLNNTFKKSSKKNKALLKLSLGSVELALNVIKNMRYSYTSAKSKLYITENEKEFYILAIENALTLYELSQQRTYLEKAYQFSQQSKAVVLLNEINQNEAFLKILPPALKEKKKELQQNIRSYKKLIFDENKKREVNESKISLWQSNLFKANKEYENLMNQVKKDYPDYLKLVSRTDIFDLEKLQKRLNSEEILVEYSYCSKKDFNWLYTFVISHTGIKYYRTKIDKRFEQNLYYIKKVMSNTQQKSIMLEEYNKLNSTSFTLYNTLLKPVIDDFSAKKIIIIPDEQIGYLSFDALISDYQTESTINFAGINYLVYNYQFSYAYSSNLLFNKQEENVQSNFIYAFAPSYKKLSSSKSHYSFGELKSSKKEISSILNSFKGKAYIGDSAIKDNFKLLIHEHGIFHFALHAKSEQNDSEYSFLAFTSTDSISSNNFLYNYEISATAMNASMVVLSACNTGDGKVYSGEGIMSLSRGFILAGVSSVVHTLWEVRDETSAQIMAYFYEYLAKGKSKREALQLAKIKYIKSVNPQMVNPSYWSAYVLSGNYAPIVKNNWQIYTLLSILFIGVLISLVIFKRKKKKLI